MRLMSFEAEGRQQAGVVVGDAVTSLAAASPGERSPIHALLALDATALAALPPLGIFALGDIALRPVVPDPHAIWCSAGTYRAHLKEGGHKETSEPPWFLRVAGSLCAPGAPIFKPTVSDRLDFEGELAVVIGTRARHVAEADAMRHVAGFTCFNDASVRDWQVHSTQVTAGKNFASTGAFGPWLVTPDEFGDPYSKRLQTRLNDVVVQSAMIGELMFPIARMIAYLSVICPLLPGDVVVTGTPAGVGNRRTPQLFMKSGDVVEVEVDGIGTLRNPIALEIA